MTTAALWTPPEGMDRQVAAGWRKFYTAAMTNYGISPADYRELYLAQLGRCYICRKAKGMHPDDPKGRGGRRLAIDHNHLLGNRRCAVRGLLCSGGDRTCNRIIGWIGVDALQRAVQYLNDPPARVVFAVLDDPVAA